MFDKNTKRCAALKIDFKFSKNKLKIIDIGDGLAADTRGFEDIPLAPTILQDLHEYSGASLATIFGELPDDAMHPRTLHIPIILRQMPCEKACVNVEDLSSKHEYLLPYSEAGRIQSPVSYDWGRKLKNVAVTPVALMAMEMHKLFWYMLMQKLMRIEDHGKVLYWANDSLPKVDLNTINMKNGVFIKIADRSTGGGGEVYYAKDDVIAINTLRRLRETYDASTEAFKKHIFIIEPAYITLKQYQNREYNVTGRAFITLSFDTKTRALGVKIASAKWMFPSEQLQDSKTTEQMLSNIKHTIGMSQLSEDELKTLSKEILDSYGEVFKAGFEHDDLMEYFKDDPLTQSFLSCLRPNASYKLLLELRSSQYDESYKQKTLKGMINSLVQRDCLKGLDTLLSSPSSVDPKLFSATPAQKEQILKGLVANICYLSFVESYIKFAKTCDAFFNIFPGFIDCLKKESTVKIKLDALIIKYLKLKSHKYDVGDLNKALRQAAYVCDIVVLKLLIYTHRAEVNAISPSTQQTALDFVNKSDSDATMKKHCLLLLEQAGGKPGQSQYVESFPLGKP